MPDEAALRSPVTILFEDGDVMAIDKPSGLVVHRGFSGEEDTVVDRLRVAGRRDVHTVHRLDRGTSGVLLLAKHPEAARSLGKAFSEGRVEKRYLALVRGRLDGTVEIDHAIPRDEGGARVDARTTARAVCAYVDERSLLRERRYTLVEAWPHTGRFHQVRRHLKHVGHPVIGDTTYGRSEHNAHAREALGLTRLFLHAVSLRLAFGDREVAVEAPLPPALARVLGALTPAPQLL